MSFYKDFILLKNPHEFNPNRLLGVNYKYNEDGDEYWDNGFVITAGPFARFSKYAKGPLQDMSPGAVAAFGRDYCETYSLCLTFVQMTNEYVEYLKICRAFLKYNMTRHILLERIVQILLAVSEFLHQR